MVSSQTDKFGLVIVDEDDYYDYTSQFKENFVKLDRAVKDDGSNLITALIPADIPLALQAAAGQTAALLETRNAAGTVIGRVTKDGKIFGPITPWTSYNNGLFNATTNVAIGTAPTSLGTGGVNIGKYRMLDEFTMALRISTVWGNGANAGGVGFLRYKLPPGYKTPNIFAEEQWGTAKYANDTLAGQAFPGMAFFPGGSSDLIRAFFNISATNTNQIELGTGPNTSPGAAPLTGAGGVGVHIAAVIEVAPQ